MLGCRVNPVQPLLPSHSTAEAQLSEVFGGGGVDPRVLESKLNQAETEHASLQSKLQQAEQASEVIPLLKVCASPQPMDPVSHTVACYHD